MSTTAKVRIPLGIDLTGLTTFGDLKNGAMFTYHDDEYVKDDLPKNTGYNCVRQMDHAVVRLNAGVAVRVR
jgi:hypothetical protein